MTDQPKTTAAEAPAPYDQFDDGTCPNCGGEGSVPGCFEDTCVCGAEDDVDGCCSPRTCDWCGGDGMSSAGKRDAY